MEGDEGRGYERKRSIESMRRARLGESSGGKQRQDCKSYRSMERIEGGVRGGAPLSIHQRNHGTKKFRAKSYPEKKSIA
jgi:hypothetical protein